MDRARGFNCRFWTLGIGSGVSTYLVKGLARVSAGHAAFATDSEDIEPCCMSLLAKALTPGISNLEITWPTPADDDFQLVTSSGEAAHTTTTPSAVSFFDPTQKDAHAFQPPVP